MSSRFKNCAFLAFGIIPLLLQSSGLHAETGAAVISEASYSPPLLQQIHIELASLVTDAAYVARHKDAEDIQNEGRALLSMLKALNSEQEERVFLRKFAAFLSGIFPEDEPLDLEQFRSDVTVLLADMNDALPLLIEGDDERQTLRADLADLQSRLFVVSNPSQFPDWLSRFALFTQKILAHTSPAKLSVLISDTRSLLTQLEEYLFTLNQNAIETDGRLTTVREFQQELNAVTTQTQLDELLDELEVLLTAMTPTSNE